MLAWNNDSTRMPERMHSEYLRGCWLENVAGPRRDGRCIGERLRVSEINTDTYIVAAIDDHIVPWRSSYKTTQLCSTGDTRFVLSSSGHIAGIINPPSPKARLWTNEHLPDRPDAWLERATKSEQSWWQDWAEWIAVRSGARVAPPPWVTRNHPALCDAPGDVRPRPLAPSCPRQTCAALRALALQSKLGDHPRYRFVLLTGAQPDLGRIAKHVVPRNDLPGLQRANAVGPAHPNVTPDPATDKPRTT